MASLDISQITMRSDVTEMPVEMSLPGREGWFHSTEDLPLEASRECELALEVWTLQRDNAAINAHSGNIAFQMKRSQAALKKCNSLVQEYVTVNPSLLLLLHSLLISPHFPFFFLSLLAFNIFLQIYSKEQPEG
jgi:hypothetical protein